MADAQFTTDSSSESLSRSRDLEYDSDAQLAASLAAQFAAELGHDDALLSQDYERMRKSQKDDEEYAHLLDMEGKSASDKDEHVTVLPNLEDQRTRGTTSSVSEGSEIRTLEEEPDNHEGPLASSLNNSESPPVGQHDSQGLCPRSSSAQSEIMVMPKSEAFDPLQTPAGHAHKTPLRNAFDLMKQAPSSKKKIQAYAYETPGRKSPENFSKKRKLNPDGTLRKVEAVDDDDADVLIIPELPPYAAKRNNLLQRIKQQQRQKQQQDFMRHYAQNGQKWNSDVIEIEDAERQPGYRAYATEFSAFSGYGSWKTPPNYGSNVQPIDVDEDDPGEGTSGTQMVNGTAIGGYSQGRYIPFLHPTQRNADGSLARASTKDDLGIGDLFHNNGYLDRQNAPASAFDQVSHYVNMQNSFLKSGYGVPGSMNTTPTNNPLYNNHYNRYAQYQTAYQQNQISTEDLNNLLENIKDPDIPMAQREGNPVGLTKSLLEHQRIGLTWLRGIEAGTNKGGILADAMGLGKTIQSIALILSRPATDFTRKSTLVVAPVSLLRQWEREINVMTFPTPSIYIHHGPRKLFDARDIADFDIILTSYSTIGFEQAALAKYEEQSEAEPLNAGVKPNTPMLDVEWYRVILDEAHFIKNKLTRSAKGCCLLKAQHRWALTGTPMQNSVEELYSLIHFLRIRPFNDYALFSKDIGKPLTRKNQADIDRATTKLQALLTAIMLRRTKDSKIDGNAILHLPEKHIILEKVTMGEDERKHYMEVETGARQIMQKALKQDKPNVGTNMLVLLLKLRQTCDHPLLSGSEEPTLAMLSHDEGLDLAKTLSPEIVERVNSAIMDGFECPVCYDVTSSGITILATCGHYYCGECLLQQVENNRREREEDTINCPQCRAPFDLKCCITLRQFKTIHNAEALTKEEKDMETFEAKVDQSSEARGTSSSSSSLFLTAAQDSGTHGDRKGKGKRRVGHRAPPLSGADRFLQTHNLTAADFVASAKVEKCMSLVLATGSAHPGEKMIIFSQFTSFLDILELPLTQAAVKFLRYDGSLRPEQRNAALMTFEDDATFTVILVSLKAGNVGLNLTCANHIVMVEAFYNPYVEDQAIDRAHRIGQTREVWVYRLFIEDSVEARVLAIQQKKRALIEGAMDAGKAAAITKLGKHEIAFLFGIQ